MQAVLFDLDGTLANTLEDLALSMNWCLERMGHPTHPLDAYKYFVGDGLAMMCRRVLPDDAEDEIPRLSEMMLRRYSAHQFDNTKPYPGVPEMLAAIDAAGLPMSVLSNKPHEQTAAMVRALFPDAPFRIVAGQKEGVPRKPDPAGALLIAEGLSATPADVLYLGDTGTDMMTANATGMIPVGALWGFRTKEELLANGARFLAETPADVVELTKGT